MRSLLAALIACLTLMASASSSLAQSTPSEAAAGPPDWWRTHVDFLSRGGGVWLTPNAAAASDPNAPDEFGMEWRAVNDGHGLTGRLFGVEAGREIAEYWTFREFWHPGERRVFVHQWGGPGVYGFGETIAPAPDRSELDQTFWLPDGRSWREGHRNEERGDIYVTQSFDISPDGQWTLSSTNTWRRQAVNADAGQ